MTWTELIPNQWGWWWRWPYGWWLKLVGEIKDWLTRDYSDPPRFSIDTERRLKKYRQKMRRKKR